MQDKHEVLAAVSSGGVSVSKDVLQAEPAEAEGIYNVGCIGPVEEYRDRYVYLRDVLLEAEEEASRDGVEVTTKLLNFQDLQDEFLSIPMEEKWTDVVLNVVTTVGKNLALDTFLAGSAYTVVGPYLGLIDTNASAAVAGDTMSSHAGWLEVGGANAPTYTGTRKTAAWSAASAGSKALSSALSYAITSSGTVGGCFLVFGSGAVNTIDSTAGVLYSAGAFTNGSKTVANGDTLNVSYTASL